MVLSGPVIIAIEVNKYFHGQVLPTMLLVFMVVGIILSAAGAMIIAKSQ